MSEEAGLGFVSVKFRLFLGVRKFFQAEEKWGRLKL